MALPKNSKLRAVNEPDPREARVLVSPCIKFGFFVDFWLTEMADDGSPVRVRKSIPFLLQGAKTQGMAAGGSDPLSADVRTPVVTVEISEGKARELSSILEYPVPPGERMYEGCRLVVTPDLAISNGIEADEEEGGKTAFQKLCDQVLKSSTYGSRMAFVDDEKSLENLLPQFEKNLGEAFHDQRNAYDYIALSAQDEAAI